MTFDLETAIAVREREDGLLEKDTFDLATAVPVTNPRNESIGIDYNARYTPPLTAEQKAQAVVELTGKVGAGLKADWILTSEPVKLATKNILGAIATFGTIPFYNMAKGIANASSPNSDIGKMVFDSAYKGLAENEKVDNLGGAAAKAYPDAPWQITGSMGALAEVLMFMPSVVSGVGSLLSKDKQFAIALNNARKSPKWGDLVATVSQKVNQPLEVVDQALYRKLWSIRGEADYFKVLNGNLKQATGIDLFSKAGSIPITRAKIGQPVNFTDPKGIVKSGIIKEITGERAIISMEGREVVATLSQLSLPKVEQPTEGKVIYHGTGEVFKDFDVKKSADGSIWFTDNKSKIEKGEVSATGKGQIMERIIDENKLKLGWWEEQDKYSTDELIAKGYDGLKLVDKDETTYQIFNPEKLSTPTGQKPISGNVPLEQKNLEPSGISGEEKTKQSLPEAIGKETIPIPIETGAGKVESMQPQKSETQNIESPEYPLTESMPQENDPVKKIIQALKEAKPIRAEQEALMKAERGRRIAKASAMGQNIGGEAGFHAQLGSLKGKLPKAQFETLRGKITQEDIDALFNKIRQSEMNNWDKIGTQVGLGKILGEFGGQVPTEGELKLLNDVFGKEFTDALIANRTLMQKFMIGAKEVLNVSRSVMTSIDLSAPFRQGAFMIGRIKQFAPAFGEMFKYFGSEKVFNELAKNISSRPTYELMREHGLSLTDLGTGLNAREERFMSNLAEKIPVIGKAVRASGRAYTGFLNKLRADVFDDLYSKAKYLGIEETDKFMGDLCEFINSATGRGKLPGKIDKIATSLNSVFFSPRLMASRLNLLNPAFYVTKEPFIRKEMLKSLLTFVSVWMTFLGLSALSGAEVGTDWRSSDFMKAKTGNTRIDPGAGFQQYLRMAGQLITGEYISSTTGKIMTLGEGYRALNRWDIILRQFESKEAPVASFISNWLKGKDFTGKKFNVPQEIASRFVPMVIGDAVELAKDNPNLLPLGVLGLFGVGVQTYKPQRKKKF